MKTAKDRFHEVMDSLGLSDYKVYTSTKRITARDYKNVVPFCLLSAFYVIINDLGEQTHR